MYPRGALSENARPKVKTFIYVFSGNFWKSELELSAKYNLSKKIST